MIALPRSRRIAALVVVAFVALELGYAIWAAFVAHGPLGPRVGYGPDSAVYIASARAPVWNRRFLAGPGPFGFLLLAKVAARNLRAIVIVQTVVATGAWVLLATTVVAVMRTNIARWVALLAILSLGLAPAVLQWNAFITTESLSISTLCVALALGLAVVVRGRRRDLVGFVAALAAFAFTRDTNALVVGGLAIVALAIAIRPAWRTRGLTIGIAGLAFMLTASTLSNAADPPRWYWPIGETVSIRLLADPGATRYLVAHGFPLDEATRDLPVSYVFVVGDVVRGRAYAPLRAWLHRDGRHVYVGYLLSHPGWTLRKPFDDRQRFLGSAVAVYGTAFHLQPRGALGAIGWLAAPRSVPVMELWSIAVVLALAWCCVRRRRLALVALVGLALVLAVGAFYASWHGDALEADRHALTAAIQLRLALWIGTVLVIDVLAARGSERGSAVGVPGEADLDREEHGRAPGDDERRERNPAPSGAG